MKTPLCLLFVGCWFWVADPAFSEQPTPDLLNHISYAFEEFEVNGKKAFLIQPKGPVSKPMPCVIFAPTVRGLPGKLDKRSFETLLAAGIAVAGINVGESYGHATGRNNYSLFHKELVANRGIAPKVGLLARSRGGLMAFNWAAEQPESVACIGAVYPVCDLQSWPTVKKAARFYNMKTAQLQAELKKHNPIDRLEPLVKAGVPLFIIHGDKDKIVPLDENSAVVEKRYRELGGDVTLRVKSGQGHSHWSGWYKDKELLDFLIEKTKAEGGAGADQP